MKAVLCERTFSLGKAQYKVNSKNQWQCLLWGWFPTGNNPRYEWEWIEEKHVPKEVLRQANG